MMIYNNSLNNSTRQKPHTPYILNKRRKKLLSGDSHAWGYTIEIANSIEKSYEVIAQQCLEPETKPLHHWLLKKLAA